MPLDKSPTPLPPFEEPFFVPKFILDLPQWICWRASWDRVKLKWDKKPICVATGDGRGFTRLEMGASYEEAVAATTRLNLAGVGFVFHQHNRLVGIDLDRCRNPVTGEIEAWAREVLELAETYAEVSPSGTGVHLFARGDLAGTSAIKNGPAKVEMYASGRYFTITGTHVPGTPFEVREAPRTLEALRARLAAMPAASAAKPVSSHPAPPEGSPEAFKQWSYKQSFFGRVNDLALKPEMLAKWVSELFPPASLEPGTGAWRVKSADLSRPLEEDISIHPGGIRDFGVGDMGDLDTEGVDREGKRTAIDLVMEWLPEEWRPREEGSEIGPAEAALWLCEQMGVEALDLGWRGPLGDGEEGGDEGAMDDEREDGIDVHAVLGDPSFEHDRQEIIIEGFERGEVTLVGGPSGAMKSLFMEQFAMALSAGVAGPTGLATIDYCGPVVYFANEDAPKQVLKRFDAIEKRHGLKGPYPHKLWIRTGRLLVRNKSGAIVANRQEVAALEDLARGGGLALIVVDTLAAALVSEETNLEFQQTMNLLKALAAKTGAAVAVVHHFRKGAPGAKGVEAEATLESLRGGSTLTASARNVLFVEKPSKVESEKYGLGDEAKRHMKLTQVKSSYGALGEVRWFRLETALIAVVDRRTGEKGMEAAPALVPILVSGQAMQRAALREALARLAACAVEIRQTERAVQSTPGRGWRYAHEILETSIKNTDRFIKELAQHGCVDTTVQKPKRGRPYCTVVVLRSELPETAENDEDEDLN